MKLNEVDAGISEISKELDFYSILTPVNKKEEMVLFFKSIKEGKKYNPQFLYRNNESGDMKIRLFEMKTYVPGDEGVESFLRKKIDFILGQIELLEANDDSFKENAIKLHGIPGTDTIAVSRDILEKSREEEGVFTEETVSPVQMAGVLGEELKRYNLEWKCEVSKKIIPKITCSSKDRKIYINASLNYTVEEVDRLRVHEILVHVFRGANGDNQSYRIFREGLAGYNETEEGLAMAAEKISGVLRCDKRQEKLYAGRALCVSLALEMSFYDMFMELKSYFPEYISYRLAERCKRGLCDTSKKGGLTKGFHYISGWRKVNDYIDAGGDLSILYVGKIRVEDVDEVKLLLEEGLLTIPEYIPDFIK